jgi:hypothetical protein
MKNLNQGSQRPSVKLHISDKIRIIGHKKVKNKIYPVNKNRGKFKSRQ